MANCTYIALHRHTTQPLTIGIDKKFPPSVSTHPYQGQMFLLAEAGKEYS